MNNEAVSRRERTPERIPSHKEVRALFSILANGKEFRNIKKKENEKGLYVWEIQLKELNEDGETVCIHICVEDGILRVRHMTLKSTSCF